ncbi:ANTAR domain-containing protein [Antrihabitans cavernicola]|uniref:ANTAR domain-containing protein n=1 Tax=Antrihabitans cavernicola TaxID=2495913 RepID=A0A5A7S3M3_9NOCA|nr:ANTAR domain-containing protein [Spelaeibacter cavernicola]KAA0016350.1 ANTAR domain-containing protein [Spelaeibacter cavernicola]
MQRPKVDRVALLSGRVVLDQAEGILIASRRCREELAFEELLDAARRHHLGVLQMARALVRVATGDSSRSASTGSEQAATTEWGELLHQRPGDVPHPI